MMRTLVVCGDRPGGGVIDRTSDVGKLASFGRRVGISCCQALRLFSIFAPGPIVSLDILAPRRCGGEVLV